MIGVILAKHPAIPFEGTSLVPALCAQITFAPRLSFLEVQRVILSLRQRYVRLPFAVEVDVILARENLDAVAFADVQREQDALGVGIAHVDGSVVGDLADGDVAAAGGEFARAAREGITT